MLYGILTLQAVVAPVVLSLAGCGNMLPLPPYHYPTASNMPPVVDEPMPSLLNRFEAVLKKKAPSVAEALQPGLSEAEIAKLEAEYNVQLPEDLRLLYQWHNGIPWNSGPTITPLHEFYPLEHALKKHAELARQMEASDDNVTRMLEPTLSWIPLFQDAAGDGYTYDPKRVAEQGAIFDNFMETAEYTFFPSIKNVIAGFVECYDKDYYFIGTDGRVDGDFEAAGKVWTKYGSSGQMAY
jgi:cell wall assembly regulator SMI1